MSESPPEDHITRKTVVLRLPGMDEVTVRTDLEYTRDENGPLTLDLYVPPPKAGSGPWPVVLLVAGYPDPGMRRILGCRTKEMGLFTSWGRLIGASGMAAVAYENREPARDIHAVLRWLREGGTAVGLDSRRIALLASSGHAPLALATLIDDRAEAPLRGAALTCPLLLDLDGFTATADAAKTYGFANPAAGRTVDDLPDDTALFIARAGLDETPGLNDTLDRFVGKALRQNLDLTLANLPHAPHAFELLDDRETSREAIRRALGFLRFQLSAEGA